MNTSDLTKKCLNLLLIGVVFDNHHIKNIQKYFQDTNKIILK
jgi:hypothetical protein